MNIFVLDRNPRLAAQGLYDKHVVKMPLEYAQIICTVADRLGVPDTPYQPTHQNHPCVQWAAESLSNFKWLVSLTRETHAEYRYRYEKQHASEKVVRWARGYVLQKPIGFGRVGLVPPRNVTADGGGSFRSWDDAIIKYRQYYLTRKSRLFSYTNRTRPPWTIVSRAMRRGLLES